MHFAQMGFTDDLTFIPTPNSLLFKAIGDTAPRQIIGRHFHCDFIARQNTNKMHPHFPRDMRQYDMAVVEFYAKHGIRKRFRDGPLNFDNIFFRHVVLYSFL